MRLNLRISKYLFIFLIVAAVILPARLAAQKIVTDISVHDSTMVFSMSNEKVTCKVVLNSDMLESDTLAGNPVWLKQAGCKAYSLATDADFGLRFVWTDWQAPHSKGNAENPVTLGKNDFIFTDGDFHESPDLAVDLILNFKAMDAPYNPILVKIIYHLDTGAFYVKRKITVRDTLFGHHFLDQIEARAGIICGMSRTTKNSYRILKEGGFGQPVALTSGDQGAFFGLEYPASTNTIKRDGSGNMILSCFQELGIKAGKEPVESEWVVEAIVPGTNVKDMFFQYLDRVRVAPLRPYTLYNSWYDLRSPEYPHVEPDHVMNEKNVLCIIDLFKKNMIGKHHISLDAFVLDDGWDVYASDWVLRKETFPNGLKPISDTLAKLGTGLGIWYGPTGGYSFRLKRVNWMSDHGYETVGTTRDNKMLCLAGKRYSGQFRKRVTDMVSLDGISYFKWDGIQFSCSEEDHGHPVGIYSRRAVMESVIDKCRAARGLDPDVFLNITSGTWLSPWWVKYANTIWMQGEDYGYANIPCINQRDAAMTYKDLVLYSGLRDNDYWFPVSNLMTHGIIKGNLERLGGEDDPLDKFTNDVVFYLARGVSMYELYISPDLLNEQEWNAIGQSIAWAKDRFDILSSTYMVGGSVPDGEAYGYVHFRGDHGIIAARNPVIKSSALTADLSSDMGFDPKASNLVLEKVYPYHCVSPVLYSSGSTLTLPLEGFETAVYEIYPLPETKGFPDTTVNPRPSPEPLIGKPQTESVKKKNNLMIRQHIELDPSIKEARFAILLEPGEDSGKKDFPVMTVSVDGKKEIKPTVEQEKGKWAWFSFVIGPGTSEIKLNISCKTDSVKWNGTGELYLVCRQKQDAQAISLITTSAVPYRPMLPTPFGEGIVERTISLGKIEVGTGR